MHARSAWSRRRTLQAVAALGLALTVLAAGGLSAQVLAGSRQRPAAADQVSQAGVEGALTATVPTAAPAPPAVEPTVVVGSAVARVFQPLAAQLTAVESAAGARIAVSIIELGGANPQSWSFHGDDPFIAASTYKLPLLMAEAESIAAGQDQTADQLCYAPEDWEDGWFQDYGLGSCYSRADLAGRIGQASDNTAAHMLVRFLGGGAALNTYAAGHGATESAFYDPNTTTAGDLARLMAAEATGEAGGISAQRWLYPLLTHSAFEHGIPGGVPASATVVHKTGELDSVTNDVAVVLGGTNGPYVVAVCVDGPGGDAGFSVIAQVASVIWQMESTR